MKTNILKFLTAGAMAVGLANAADYTAWSGHRDIVLNTSPSGANVTNDVTKFPVLIRLTEDEVAIIAESKPEGADIRFSKADDATPLPYQIDSWEPWGAAIWVLVDTVYGNNSTQKIRLHWGNPAADSESNGSAVFDTANGFVGVWHLGNAPGASPRPNSVAGAPTAAFRNAPITQQPVRGIIGMADSLTGGPGSDDGEGNEQGLGLHIDLSGGTGQAYEGYSDFTGGVHYSIWVNPNANYSNFERFLQMVDDTTYSSANSSSTRLMFFRHTNNNGSLGVRTAGLGSGNSGNFPQHPGVWKQLVINKAPGNSAMTIYVDGVQFYAYNATEEIPVSPRQYAWIGRSFDPANAYLNAKVDAPMLSKVNRSPAWIKLSYENQKQANTLVDIGHGGPVTSLPYAAWGNHRTITLNTSASGANVAGDVANFPVLIRLTKAEQLIIDAAKAGGADIRFSRNDFTPPFPHYIESWDDTSAAIWVKVDSVKGNNAAQTIRMHWGNPAATDSSNSAAVFDTANGFVSVWNMKGSANETDATGNGLDAEATGTVPAVAGLIGKARSFSDLDNYLKVPGSASGKLNFAASDDYTLSAWVHNDEVVSDNSTGHAIVNKGNDQWLIGIYGDDEDKYYDIMTRGNDSWNQAPTNAAGKEITAQGKVKTWVHVTGTWKGSGSPQDTARIYINGQLANTTSFNNLSDAGRNLTRDVHIGVLGGNDPSRPFVGRIDEITISKVVRDSNWVKLAYENQKPGNSLVNIGTYVPATVAGAPTGVTAAATNGAVGSVTVSWTAPANDGGSPILNYIVSASPGTQSCQSTPPATTCAVTGLTPGQTYTFTVVAVNAQGNSQTSAASTAVLVPTSLMPGSFAIRMDGLRPYTYRIPASLAAVTQELTMSIVDIHGKRVWSRTVKPSEGKNLELTWDGKNMSGSRVSAGMYIVRIRVKMNDQVIESTGKGAKLKN